MKKSFYLFVLLAFIYSCTSPSKALEKGRYHKAFRLANRQIHKGKDVDNNIQILRAAGKKIIQKEIAVNQNLLQSNDVKDWIIVRKRYYNVLNKIGKANLQTNGALSDVYDQLCEPKTVLDEKIAKVFYDEGNAHFDDYDQFGNKKDAQKAYYAYKECIENGGLSFFQDVQKLKDEALELGIVYYQSHGRYRKENLFLRQLPPNANFMADCLVDVSLGFMDTDRSESTSSTSYTTDVFVENKIEVDTSGISTTTPIYESVSCTVKTTTVTYTLTQHVEISVVDQTGQCSISSEYYPVSVSDSYDIIEISGDERAAPIGVEEKDAPAFFRSKLERDLDFSVENSF